MPPESSTDGPAWRLGALALLPLLLAACAATPPTAPPPPAAAPPPTNIRPASAENVVPVSAPAPAPAPAPATAAPRPAPASADVLLAYADRIRAWPAPELAAEIQRLGEGSYSPLRALQLAMAIAQARTSGQWPRAQALVQRVLAQQDADAQALHPIARMLSAQYAELRRLDEQAERQGRELREAQRRIEALNERLEAVRAIERSLPSRQRRDSARPD